MYSTSASKARPVIESLELQGRRFGFDLHQLTLFSVIVGMETQHVFEFGCGRSTETILHALDVTGGKLITNDLRTLEQCGVFKDAIANFPNWQNLSNGIHEFPPNWTYYREQSSTATCWIRNSTSHVFDVILHDGSHERDQVIQDLTFILPRLRNGGILLIHDTNAEEWGHDFDLKSTIEPSLKVSGITKWELVTLPYGYGLTIVRILERNHEVKWHPEHKLTWSK